LITNYSRLPGGIRYRDREARHIILQRVLGCIIILILIFALRRYKGELFIIKAPELNLDVIVNTSVFILPLGGDLFKVGATQLER
jgi:hypothetical protein